MLACSRSGAERADVGAAWFPAPVPARDPIRASEHASPAHLTSQLHAGVRAATNKARAVLWQREATQSQSGVRVGRRQPRLALTQAARQKMFPIPDADTTKAHTPVHSERPSRPLQLDSASRRGWQKLRGVTAERGKGCSAPKAELKPDGAAITVACSGSRPEAARPSVRGGPAAPPQAERLHGALLLQHHIPFRQGC